MHINADMNIREILEKFPESIDVFTNNGFKGLDDERVLEVLEKITLREALKLKKSDLNSFMALIEESITTEPRKNKEDAVSLMGLLPCPVRIPLLEGFKKFLDNNPDINVNYELKAASSGLAWLDLNNLADMFISAGFDLFFEKERMGKFKAEGLFKDITGIEKYNSDFENETISLKDPYGDYSMLGVVPAIFLVNKDIIGDRPMPTSWKDILDPKFKKSVSLPIADFDLFNAILVNIYKNFGEEGVRALGNNLLESMHPAQMVGSNGPAITIMPYFFSKMIKEDGPMSVVWPEEGAIISPIFMLTKKSKEKELKKIAEFMSGEAVGNIISQQGLFPSVNPNVKNPTSGKPMMWVGWDYIYNNDIGKLIKHCEEIFNEGVRA
ncbi:MAG: ABC transporter substrate-binding protein [Cetobacterium sp.]|uniref:ABC transporter substrate-binding protein n=1 Tax=Cetobacterium sp. TaxID=2071632 RepID=UPI002FC781B9